ncbi:CCDC65 family protein [Megaselia abdita]
MGKKKGGAKNKLAKMSEEERARYLQHRADVEVETRRRKQQLISLYMKNKLKKEENFARLNLSKINQEWRSILRNIKVEQLRKEFHQIEIFFNASLEQKNRIINKLLKQLDIAEDMYLKSHQSNLEDLKMLTDIHEKRVNFFLNKYKEIVEQTKAAYKQNVEGTHYERNKALTELSCIYYSLQDKTEETITEDHEAFVSKLYDLKSNMRMKVEGIIKSREEELNNFWSEYQTIIDDYAKRTENCYSEYIELKEIDDENAIVISSNVHAIENSTEQLAKAKNYYEKLCDQTNFKIDYLQTYRDELKEKLTKSKQNVEHFIRQSGEQFKVMSVASHAAIKFLERIYKKLEYIKQVAMVCGSLMTDNDEKRMLLMDRELFKNSMLSFNYKHMENFWYKVNNVQVDTTTLRAEKKSLEKENAHLKQQLKAYLSAAVVASSGMTSGSGKTTTKRRPSRPTTMNATHIFLKSKRNENLGVFGSRGTINNRLKSCV